MSWWQVLPTQGPGFGYFPNALKTVLIVKPHLFSVANSLFSGTKVQITERGQRHLGAALGSRDFAEDYVSKKVCSWVAEVSTLANIAATRPHALSRMA